MELKEYINVVSVCHMYVGTGHELRMGRVPRRFDKRGSKKRSFALICDESLCHKIQNDDRKFSDANSIDGSLSGAIVWDSVAVDIRFLGTQRLNSVI